MPGRRSSSARAWPGQRRSWGFWRTRIGVVICSSSPRAGTPARASRRRTGCARRARTSARAGAARRSPAGRTGRRGGVAVEGAAIAGQQRGVRLGRQRLRPQRRDVDDAGVGDGGREAVLEGERPDHAVARVLEADHGQPRGIDIRAREHRVRDGGEHGFPVRAQREALFEQRALTAGAVERHPVVAAGVRGRTGLRPGLRCRLAPAVVDHRERARLAAGAEDVARQGRVLVRDREPGAAEQLDRPLSSRFAGGATARPR